MKIDFPAFKKVRALRSAFTLPEVMMAVGTGAVMFVTIYLAIAQGVVVVKNCRENLRATQILEEKAETIRLISWDQVTNNFVPQTFTNYYDPSASSGKQGVVYQGIMSMASAPISETYASTMRQFLITVKWSSAGIQHQKAFSTFVSQFGLQNYVYPVTKPGA
jgi:hypothetical protein